MKIGHFQNVHFQKVELRMGKKREKITCDENALF